MDIKELKSLMKNEQKVDKKIDNYIKNKIIHKKEPDENEIKGHVQKSEHNLSFSKEVFNLGYLDWAVTGCYYSLYHMSLALTSSKGYISKNHDATVCLLIKLFSGINQEDLTLINNLFLDYKDLLFYLDIKQKREISSYSTNYRFDRDYIESLRTQSLKLINKMRDILDEVNKGGKKASFQKKTKD